jgi:hypothetical protein
LRYEAQHFFPLPSSPRFSGGDAPPAFSGGLALSLLMFGVFTDHADHPFSFYNFTLVADFLDRCPDFHCLYPIVEEIEFNFQIPPRLPADKHPSSISSRTDFTKREVRGDYLFLPKDDSPPREIIRGEFHRHLIPWEDFDEVHSHLSRNMGQHLVAVFQFDSEHGIGKGFQNLPFHLDRILLWHSVSIRTLKRAMHLRDGQFD